MPQTRTKPRKPKSAKAPIESNGVTPPTTEVFNFAEAAAYLRVTESDLMRLVHDQALPGRQFGTEWRFLKSAIQDWLKTPPKRGSREAVLSTAGSWKDDPEMVAETMAIYHKRREDLVGDME